jgi:hypothetical protein
MSALDCDCLRRTGPGRRVCDSCKGEIVAFAQVNTIVAASKKFGVSQPSISGWCHRRDYETTTARRTGRMTHG